MLIHSLAKNAASVPWPALIGAIASIMVCVLGLVYNEVNKRNYKIWETTLARCDEQIGRLYAPLTNLVEQLHKTDEIKTKMVEQDPDDASEISRLFYENYFTPIHQKIAVLLETQLHLLEDETIPESFTEYYAHVASEKVMFTLFNIRDRARQEGRITAGGAQWSVTPTPYPGPKFKDDIMNGFRKIQARQERMLKNIRTRTPLMSAVYGFMIGLKNRAAVRYPLLRWFWQLVTGTSVVRT